jgi:regulator of replication initiation timing|tara:strand:- start:748 stop:963 length:216 start_codon:yes stop_codon:yes gene_type:complete
MKKIFKFALIVLGLRYVVSLMDENVDIKIQIKKLRNELANLETEDLENKLKDFFKKYDPKFKDQEENQEDF